MNSNIGKYFLGLFFIRNTTVKTCVRCTVYVLYECSSQVQRKSFFWIALTIRRRHNVVNCTPLNAFLSLSRDIEFDANAKCEYANSFPHEFRIMSASHTINCDDICAATVTFGSIVTFFTFKIVRQLWFVRTDFVHCHCAWEWLCLEYYYSYRCSRVRRE